MFLTEPDSSVVSKVIGTDGQTLLYSTGEKLVCGPAPMSSRRAADGRDRGSSSKNDRPSYHDGGNGDYRGSTDIADIADDAEFRWYIDKDWFRSEKCLRDFVAVHAPQLSQKYKSGPKPYPSVMSTDMDAFMDSLLQSRLGRDDDEQIDFENETAEIGEAIEILKHLSFQQRKREGRNKGDDFIGFAASDVSPHFSDETDWRKLSDLLVRWNHSGDDLFTNALGTNGWFVLVDEKSKSVVWFLPLNLLIRDRHRLKRLGALARRITQSLSEGGDADGDVPSKRHRMASSSSAVLQALLTAWTQLQYAMFHLLVFRGIFDDAHNHPERWYQSSSDSKSRSGLAEFIRMVRSGDESVAAVQTYVPWWWETFQVGDVIASAAGNSRMARRVFSKLNRKLLRE